MSNANVSLTEVIREVIRLAESRDVMGAQALCDAYGLRCELVSVDGVRIRARVTLDDAHPALTGKAPTMSPMPVPMPSPVSLPVAKPVTYTPSALSDWSNPPVGGWA